MLTPSELTRPRTARANRANAERAAGAVARALRRGIGQPVAVAYRLSVAFEVP